jgi:hypothetical protein
MQYQHVAALAEHFKLHEVFEDTPTPPLNVLRLMSPIDLIALRTEWEQTKKSATAAELSQVSPDERLSSLAARQA